MSSSDISSPDNKPLQPLITNMAPIHRLTHTYTYVYTYMFMYVYIYIYIYLCLSLGEGINTSHTVPHLPIQELLASPSRAALAGRGAGSVGGKSSEKSGVPSTPNWYLC